MDFSTVSYYRVSSGVFEKTDVSNRLAERCLGHVVANDGNIDDKPGKYGWNSCKLQLTITKWLFRTCRT